MVLSRELQIGKAGEHLVCFDLILQGYNAFLADQGLPFDVLVEKDGKLKTIQVRSSGKIITYKHAKDIYRFGTRRGKGRKIKDHAAEIEVDYYAFVALDIKQIAYIPIIEMSSRNGKVKQTVDLKSRTIKYLGRVYTNGTIRSPEWGRYLQDYEKFEFK